MNLCFWYLTSKKNLFSGRSVETGHARCYAQSSSVGCAHVPVAGQKVATVLRAVIKRTVAGCYADVESYLPCC